MKIPPVEPTLWIKGKTDCSLKPIITADPDKTAVFRNRAVIDRCRVKLKH